MSSFGVSSETVLYCLSCFGVSSRVLLYCYGVSSGVILYCLSCFGVSSETVLYCLSCFGVSSETVLYFDVKRVTILLYWRQFIRPYVFDPHSRVYLLQIYERKVQKILVSVKAILRLNKKLYPKICTRTDFPHIYERKVQKIGYQ